MKKPTQDFLAVALMEEFGDPPDGDFLQFDADGNEVNVPLHMREERARLVVDELLK